MDPIRLIMIGVAGYLVYSYYQKQATIPPGTVGGGTVTPGGGTTTTPPIDLPANGDGTVANGTFSFYNFIFANDPTYVAKVPSGGWDTPQDYVMAMAANGDLNAIHTTERYGLVMSADQWNFYRVIAGAAPVDPSLMDALRGDGTDMTATEYRRRINYAGLSGFSDLGGLWA